MGLGGYDMGYEIYYRGTPIGRVDYGDKEYELYVDDFITRETLPEFLTAIDARGFKNIHEKDMGPYKEGDWVSWNDQKWYIDDGWFDDEDRHYLYTIKQLDGHKMDAVPEEELTPLDDDESSSNTVNESMSLKDITKRYSAEQRTALDGKSWWVVFDNETGKYIPGSKKYKTKRDCETGIIINMKHGRLDANPDELDTIDVAFGGMKTESARKQKMKFKKIVGESGKIDLLKDTQVITNGRDAKINVDCPYCGETRYLTSLPISVWKLGCRKVEQGVPVAKAFPSLNPSDRETLETGKCRICQMKHANESTRKNEMKFKKIMKESIDNLESFLSKQEKEFKPSRVNPSWDDSEDKIWAVQDYLSRMGEFTDEDREFLKQTDPELLSLEEYDEQTGDETSNPDFKPLDQAMWEIGRTSNGKKKNESFVDGDNKDDMVNEEADDGDNYTGDTPKIYVGTYAKYNDGSIDGKWVDLSEYNTYEEFVDACCELHKDEKDPEFMVQDYENFPEKWYHEGGLPTEEEFNKINEYYMMDDDRKGAYEAFVNYTGLDSMDDFEEAYEGKFDSAEDFAYNMVENLGWDGIGSDNLEMYFDYDSFGRDLMYDFHIGDPDNTDSEGEPEDPDHYYDNEGYDQGEYESDRQVAEDYVDSLGGVDRLGSNAQNYFDYAAFGRDLFINDYFEEDGYVFRHI